MNAATPTPATTSSTFLSLALLSEGGAALGGKVEGVAMTSEITPEGRIARAPGWSSRPVAVVVALADDPTVHAGVLQRRHSFRRVTVNVVPRSGVLSTA